MLRWSIAAAEAYNDCADGKRLLVQAVQPPSAAANAPAGSTP